MDIEFIAQYLSLAFAHAWPGILDVSTRKVIEKAGAAGLIRPSRSRRLSTPTGSTPMRPSSCALRSPGPFDPAKAAAGVKRRIAAATGFPDFEAFIAALDEARKRVREAYETILGR